MRMQPADLCDPSPAPNGVRPFIYLVGGEVKREKSEIKLNM